MKIDLDSENEDGVDVENATENEQNAESKIGTKRQRRKTSKVWAFFDLLPLDAEGVEKARCKKCKTSYISNSKFGTGNLKRHVVKCQRNGVDIGQYLVHNSDGSMSMRSQNFNQETFKDLVTVAILRHELPFQFVEYEGIREIFTYLCVSAKNVTRNTSKADVLKLFGKEKHKLSNLLRSCPGRISLTSDLWTSIATDGYICLTAHFIDKDWILQKRILNFCYLPPPHSGIALAKKVYKLLCDWGIENKLFSITLDNASSNDVFVELLKSQLSLKGALLGDGSFFHIWCCAHIINLIVQEGLKEIDGSVSKMRECVKYVKGSQVRKQKFYECVAQVSLNGTKSLRQDVPTRWNSTFLMLGSALYYRRAFCHLQLSDSNFKHCPSPEEWGKAEKIYKFLGVLYEITCIFSGVKYPTASLYFPHVFKVQLSLSKEMQSSDDFMRTIAKQMFSKFDKYWSKFSLILAIAVIFDPRYKIQFVKFCYNMLYGENSFEYICVREKLFSLFNEYMCNASKGSSSSSTPQGISDGASRDNYDKDHEKDCTDVFKEFDTFESTKFVTSAQKTQLELYLDEPKVKREANLDVLAYWRAHQFRYPELAHMARDVLSIPVSAIASESAFSTEGRVLDQYRSALRPQVVEALVCTRDWLFGGKGNEQVKLDELTEDVMNLNNNKDDERSVGCSNEVVNLDS